MPEEYTKWDVVDYLESVERAAGYLEACLEEAPEDVDFLRLAFSDVERAEGMGKFKLEKIDRIDSGVELLQALADSGRLNSTAAVEIARKLGMPIRTTA